MLTLQGQASCGPLTCWLAGRGVETVLCATITEDAKELAATLAGWADSGDVDLILTTGATCPSSREIIRRGTLGILEREIPEFAEVMRVTSLAHDPYSMLDLGLAGVRWRSLIVNLPASPTLAVMTLEALWPLIQRSFPSINVELEEWATAVQMDRVARLKVVALQGPGVERTNLLEMVSAELRGRGWQVGAMRHDAESEGLQIDHPGKESLAAYFGNVDIVLTEGFRQSEIGTISDVASKGSFVQLREGENLLAVVGGCQVQADIALFDIDDVPGIAGLIEGKLLVPASR